MKTLNVEDGEKGTLYVNSHSTTLIKLKKNCKKSIKIA